jgi:hypothetical protein
MPSMFVYIAFGTSDRSAASAVRLHRRHNNRLHQTAELLYARCARIIAFGCR